MEWGKKIHHVYLLTLSIFLFLYVFLSAQLFSATTRGQLAASGGGPSNFRVHYAQIDQLRVSGLRPTVEYVVSFVELTMLEKCCKATLYIKGRCGLRNESCLSKKLFSRFHLCC